MEDLNNTQLILLTLLVSFVTSIATGIITTSLLQEAPAEITQTINRVVEKTIERVVPEETVSGSGKPVERVETVVVKEEDLIIEAIEENTATIARIRYDTRNDDNVLYGLGFLVSDKVLVADFTQGFNDNNDFRAIFPGDVTVGLKFLAQDEASNLVFFEVMRESATPTLTSSALSGSVPQLGQTVIAIEGGERNVVGVGRITGLPAVANPEGEESVIGFETDILRKTGVYGGPLINLSGEVVGINISKTGSTAGYFSSIDAIKGAMTRHSI